MKRILRYLKGKIDYSLCYRGKSLQLRGYTDADWGGDLAERKSTSGFSFLLNDCAISWSSKKQSCIALSTMEAKFITFFCCCTRSYLVKMISHSLGCVWNYCRNCDSMLL